MIALLLATLALSGVQSEPVTLPLLLAALARYWLGPRAWWFIPVWLAVALGARELSHPPLAYAMDQRLLDMANLRLSGLAPAWGGLLLLAGLAASGRVPRPVLPLVIGPLLVVQLFLTVFAWNPAHTQRVLACPQPGHYGFDGQQYLRVWYLMKDGQGYYPASAQAAAEDVRHNNTLLRSPLWFWLWSWLPLPADTVALAFIGAWLVAMVSAWRLGGPLAAVLLLPLGEYGFLSESYLFVDFWSMAAALAATAVLVKGWEGPAFALATLAVGGRDLLAFFYLGFALEAWAKSLERRRTGAWLASSVVLLGLGYAAHQQSGYTAANLSHFLVWGGPAFLWSCLRYGFQLTLFPPLLPAVLTGLGTAGLVKAVRRPGGVVCLFSLLAPAAAFCVAGHSPVDTPTGPAFFPDYWGVLLLPWLAVGAGRLLEPPAGTPEE